MQIFHFFSFSKSKRKMAEEPKDKINFIKHGLSEFIGTILLSLALAGLSTTVAKTNHAVEVFMIAPFLIGFYAGFIAVGICLLLFLRWSCDLNPAVTITRMIQGTNTYRYGIFKIVIQMMGGIIAGLIIYGFGKLGNEYKNGVQVSNEAISAIKAAGDSFLTKVFHFKSSIALGSGLIFITELIVTSLLLFPIFSSIFKGKYRDFAIMFIISMVVWMGILEGTASLNPARGLAQQIPGLIFGHGVGGLDSSKDLAMATVAMEFGTFLAPFFYVFCRGLLREYVNPLIKWSIELKNNRFNQMHKPAENKK